MAWRDQGIQLQLGPGESPEGRQASCICLNSGCKETIWTSPWVTFPTLGPGLTDRELTQNDVAVCAAWLRYK